MKYHRFLFFLMILTALMTELIGMRNFIASIDYLSCTHNPKYFKSSNCSVDKSFHPTRAYLDVYLKRDIKNVFGAIEITLQRNKTIRKFLNLKNLNFCDFLTGESPASFLLNIRNIFKKFGEFPKKCPINKDFHFLFKDVVIDAEYLPALTPDGNFLFSITVNCDNEFCFKYVNGGSIQRI